MQQGIIKTGPIYQRLVGNYAVPISARRGGSMRSIECLLLEIVASGFNILSSNCGKASSNMLRYDTIRYDTRCYFNVRSKADMSQLNLPHGNDN